MNFYKVATIIALSTALFTSYTYYRANNPKHPTCNNDTQYIANTIQDWIVQGIPNSFLKTNKLKVTDIDNFAEYNTIPQQLYDDFKDSTVCKATVYVDFSPISTDNKNIKADDNIEEITVRYQLIGNSSIRMSGIDVNDMSEQVTEAIRKHKKK